MKTNTHVWSYHIQFFLEWGMFQKKKSCRKNQNTYFTFNNFIFENRTVHATKWKNILEAGRPQTTWWCTHFVCWIPKSTNTHTVYVILIAFPLQRTGLNYYVIAQCLYRYSLLTRTSLNLFQVGAGCFYLRRFDCSGSYQLIQWNPVACS